jgi:hypothetical protein
MVLKDCSTRKIRQNNIRHAPKTKNVAPIKVLNPPRVENQSLSRSLGLLPFQVCTRIISMENQSFDNNISAQVV